MNWILLFMILGLSTWVNANQKVINDLPKEKSYKRDQKLYSLFSIVTFKNAGCKTTSGTTGSGVNRNGKSLSMKLEYLLRTFTYLSQNICRNLLHIFRVSKQRRTLFWWLCCWVHAFDLMICIVFQRVICFRFGVCCLFMTSTSGTISENCTYLQNPGYPGAYTTTTTIQWTVAKCSTG